MISFGSRREFQRGIAVVGWILLGSIGIVENARALMIDDFGGTVATTSDVVFVTAGNRVGGELDVIPQASASYSESGGIARFNNLGITTLIYDGLDGSVDSRLGLGGIDLTDGGLSDQLAIDLSEASGHNGILIRLYTTETQFSTRGGSRLATPGRLLFSLASFQARGVDGGADLQNIERIEIEVRVNVPNSVFSLTSIATIPEPGTAMLLGLGLTVLSVRRRNQASVLSSSPPSLDIRMSKFVLRSTPAYSAAQDGDSP